jgi:ABC-type transport system involved in multi-copper enzyme maturation permease subunit
MNLLAAEWTKTRSVRSTWITAGSTVLATVAIGLLGIGGLVGAWRADLPDPWDPTAVSLKGVLVGQLLVGMLGASSITGEYATGMIAATLTRTPRRSRLLAAKAATTAALALATSLVTVTLSFAAGQAAIAGAGLPTSTLGDDGVSRALLCAVAYLTLIALLGLAFGTLTRSSSGALGVLVAVALLAPALTPALPGAVGAAIATYWPTTAGQAAYAVASTGGLPPLAGIAVLALCTVYLTVASHLVLRRRDA